MQNKLSFSKKVKGLNLFLLALCLIFSNTLFSQSKINWQSYKPEFGTISFNYPSGWEVGASDRHNSFNENYFMQPKNQYFNGKAGQVVIRIFEPVSIMEDTKSLSMAFSVNLFEKFISQITEGSRPLTQTVNLNGRTYYVCTQSNSGFITKMIGFASPHGNLYIIAMAASPTVSNYDDNILFTIAASLRGAEPVNTLSTQESAVKNWYTALSDGNVDKLKNLSCSSAQLGNSILKVAEQAFGLKDLYGTLAKQSQHFDFSHLRYYTIGANNNLSVVRVCGNIKSSDGNIKSFSNYARPLGGNNLLVVRAENGSWKVCESVQK